MHHLSSAKPELEKKGGGGGGAHSRHVIVGEGVPQLESQIIIIR